MSDNKYSIKITPKARDDLDKIYNYISEELFAKRAAEDLLNRIETSIMRLREFPFSCGYVADEFLKGKGYRKLIIDNYVAFYITDEDKRQVVIMRVLHGRRKYENLL